MTQTRDLSQIVEPAIQEDLTRGLLEITQDLDKTQVLQQTLPAWLLGAKPQTLKALEEAHRDSRRPREKARHLLGRLQPLNEFCSQRLRAFLSRRNLGFLDIHDDVLELPKRSLSGVSPDFGGALVETVVLEKHSLLQAAMQNFPAQRAEPDGMPVTALIRVGTRRQASTTLLPSVFAGYCRELDLGQAYQAHLREVFNLPSPDEGGVNPEYGYNPAVGDIGECKSLDMQIDLHIAHAKGDIDEPTHNLLLSLIRADEPADNVRHLLLNDKPMIWQGLNIDGACLWGVLVVSNASASGLVGPLLIYMPDEPVRPWYRYESLEDFKLYLSLKLQVSSYRTFFTRYLDESERFGFFQRFDRTRTLEALVPLPVTGNLSTFFFNACVGKIQLDARVLAVPKAQADEEARQKRLQDYMDAGMTLLNVAGLVVPVLGQLMMGVAVGELLGEVFEGVEDWRHNDQSEALKHLINVAQSIASMALFATGTKVVGSFVKTEGAARFFDNLEAVTLPDGRPRLWRSLTTFYRQKMDVEGLVASPRGVYQLDGQSYVKIDGSLYAIAFDGRSGKWRALHPQREKAYRPALSHNYQGGWQFNFERPQEWQDPVYLLNRLDPSLADLPTEHLQDIAAITDMSVPRLQQLAKENLPLPERFRDCAVRFKQNQKVRDLLWQMEHREHPEPATGHTQMLALPLMEGWPAGRFFEVLDSEGYLLERYPDTAPFDYEDLSIHITEQQLNAGQVMPTVLRSLNPEDTATLLGGTFEPGEMQGVLARRLVATLQKKHRQVYEQLYEGYDVLDQTDHGMLKRRYAQLPIRVAWEIMAESSITHRWQLRYTGRVPLRVVQQVREVLDVLSEDQALTGFYLPELANDATRRLAFGLLSHLSAWPRELRLQLRAGTLGGPVLEQMGSEAATVKRTVLETQAGYQTFDEQSRALGIIDGGPDGFYQALLNALSPDQLKALELSERQQASQLRYQLTARAQEQRSQLSRYLWPERSVPREPLASCVQALPAAPHQYPAALVRKVRKLYPLFDEQQISTFLHALGPDQLARSKAVRALEQQFQVLHRSLKIWCKETTTLSQLPNPLRDYRLSRHQVMSEIERCWQFASMSRNDEGLRVPSLELDNMVAGPLPSLPAQVRFDHIEQLSLKNMGLNDDVAYFLKHFKGLHSLTLTGNQMTRLPEVLSQMPALKRLYLADNQLQLTEYTRAKLAQLKELRVLNLRNNPLVDPPVIGNLFYLRNLILGNCRLKDLPVDLLHLPYLEQVDLRGNDIVTLPSWLFTVKRDLAAHINLRHNPLGIRSRLLLGNFRDNTGIGMGFLEDDIARMNEQSARALWLSDESVSRYTEMNEVWMGLKDEADSDALFKLLAELGGTADTAQVREDMTRRVWRVLEAVGADEALREEVFERAATPLNCDDAAAVSFSSLEVLVEVHESSKLVMGGRVTAKPLLKLARGLFRLDQLEGMARRHSAEHPSADPLEVSLAYRTGLVDKFHLPGQPRHMRFARLGGVTQQALGNAEAELKAAELSPELLKFLIDLPFWVDYLKRTFSHGFDVIQQPFDLRMQAVFDQALTLDDADYRDQMNEILREQGLAEKAELERLTVESLRLDELNLSCEPLVL